MKLNAVTTSLLLGSAIFCQSLAAQEAPGKKEEKPEYAGTAELGFLYKNGDVKSYDLKSRLDIRHEFDRFRNNYIFDVLFKETEQELEDGSKEMETTDQKWYTQLQTNYTINDTKKNYLFGYLSYEDDRFSSYSYQSTFSSGWGKRWYEDTEKGAFFDAEIGPGISHDETEETEVDGVIQESFTDTNFIIRASGTYNTKFFEVIEFRQTFGADIATESDKNTKIKAISQFTTKLIGSLAARLSFTVDHNTEVEEGTKNTQTETNLTFVYSF